MSRNQIVYGQWVFADAQIQNANIFLTTSMISDSLEANTFTADVECEDRTIVNFERNAPLVYSHKGVQIGIFYVQDIVRIGPTTYTISATSAIGMLIEGLHYGGIYNGETVAEILPGICGSVPYEVKSNLQNIALYGWLPVASPRDNLSQVLFAIGATVKTDLNGILRIEGLWDGVSGSIREDALYIGQDVEYAAKVTRVVVTEHQYTEGTEEMELFNGTSQAGDIITFSEPMHNLSATGFTITESGSNYAILSAGTGVLTGQKYIHNTRQVSRDVAQANTENVVSVEDATLVSLVNSVSVAERLANYYGCLETIDGDIALGRQSTGDVVNAYHPYDKEMVQACIESLDITASGILRATAKQLVGFKPIQTEQTVMYDEHELLTGSGEWSVPNGTEEVRVVLIGAGQAGFNGSAGGSARYTNGDYQRELNYRYTVSGQNPTQTRSLSANAAGSEPGEGGKGGAAGTPGKVFEITVKLNGEKSIHYSCGTAGYSSGQVGGETVFGTESSASGVVMPAGYTDLVSQVVYALSGVAGADGGDGGSAGNPGQNVGDAKGGSGESQFSKNRNSSSTGSSVATFGRVSNTATGNGTVGGAGGGGAGGSSGDTSGSNGSNANYSTAGVFLTCEGGTSATLEIEPMQGGIGGNGANGKAASTFGSSGNGGGGGGGAGATGSASGNISHTSGYPSTPASTTSTMTTSMSTWCTASSTTSVPGGLGGQGGAGADGCIILYYGVAKKVKSGAIMGSDGKIRLDKYGRLMVG